MAGFLDLPGEIRNRVYTRIFPKQHLLLRSSHPKKSFKSTSGRLGEAVGTHSSQLYAVPQVPDGNSHSHCEVVFSAQILRVCRKIHTEALPLLYSSIALDFESMKAINSFLNGASSQGMKHTTKLSIIQQGYGEPHRTIDTTWKAKHDQQWMSTCKKLPQLMPGLLHLKLYLHICDWPCQLKLGANWAKPLFFLKGSDGLERVDVSLRSSSFEQPRLEAAARMVERAMTSEHGLAQRQLEDSLQEIARMEKKQRAQSRRKALKDTTAMASAPGCGETEKPPNSVKVLTIRINEEQKRPSHTMI